MRDIVGQHVRCLYNAGYGGRVEHVAWSEPQGDFILLLSDDRGQLFTEVAGRFRIVESKEALGDVSDGVPTEEVPFR